jgi:small subunit ribosomal protein S18
MAKSGGQNQALTSHSADLFTHRLFLMSTSEQQQRSLTPPEFPFTTPQLMSRYVTDTGKILPRKYTGLSAKHQRAVTRTIKHARNNLLAL